MYASGFAARIDTMTDFYYLDINGCLTTDLFQAHLMDENAAKEIIKEMIALGWPSEIVKINRIRK